MVEMIKKKTFWITMIVICLVIIGGYAKFLKEDDNLFVTAEKVVKRDVIHKVNASGIIQPEEEVQITSMVSGWITEITVIEGDTVKPGQHLISIDKKQYQAAYDQALSQVKSSKANLKNDDETYDSYYVTDKDLTFIKGFSIILVAFSC